MATYWHNMNTLPTLDELTEAAQAAIAMSDETVLASAAIANTLTTTQCVRTCFEPHIAHAADGVEGIVQAVEHVLRTNDAEFPRNAEATEMRAIVIACAMFTKDLIPAVQGYTMASRRYQAQTVKNVLSTYGRNGKAKTKTGKEVKSTGSIVKIQLTSKEDADRPKGTKPRCKWYVVKQAGE